MFALRQVIYCLLVFISLTGRGQTPETPNVILVFIDDMAYGDVSFHNANVFYTPNLQYMADHGVVLDHFYASQPVCTASRTSLLTGCYANRLGMGGAIDHNSKSGLHPEETTLAEMLKERGYATAAIGKWHLGFQPPFLPKSQGFDLFYGIPYSADMWPFHPESPGYYPPLPLYSQSSIIDTITEQSWFTERFASVSADFITQHKEGPFFLYLAHPMPHVPLYVSKSFEGSTGKGLYADVIHELDASIGTLLSTLRQHGLEEKTLIIVTSDNGPWLAYGNHAGTTAGLREGKGTTWEGGVRVPFVAYWKGHLPERKRIQTPAMTIDMLPTLAYITSSKLPKRKIDGCNIWPMLTTLESPEPERPFYFYYHQNDLEAMRWKSWKLYFPHTYRTMQGQIPGRDGQPGKYRMVTIEEPLLYNLSTDPFENSNIASQFPDVIQVMQSMANAMRHQLGDNLTGLKGLENRPAGNIDEYPTK